MSTISSLSETTLMLTATSCLHGFQYGRCRLRCWPMRPGLYQSIQCVSLSFSFQPILMTLRLSSGLFTFCLRQLRLPPASPWRLLFFDKPRALAYSPHLLIRFPSIFSRFPKCVDLIVRHQPPSQRSASVRYCGLHRCKLHRLIHLPRLT